MTLTEMRRVLSERGLQLTKSLGQNFLHDGNQLRRIVGLAEVHPGDRVLEIGPGLGPLTEVLLAAGANVVAIEKDSRFVEFLRERFAVTASQGPDFANIFETEFPGAPAAGRHPALRLVQGDGLEAVATQRRWAGWKLVANLPYSVASPILVELALAEQPPERMVATLQWEVARRLAASAADDDYGVLSLLVQLQFAPGPVLRIPASCFFPAPDVESACVRLDRRDAALLPVELHRAFQKIVKRAFSQRRKMMLKLLRADWTGDALERAFAVAGVSAGTRAEAVALEQFVRLTESLAAPSADDRGNLRCGG